MNVHEPKRGRANAGAAQPIWLRLTADGDHAVVVFMGEPATREVCFVDGRSVPFDEDLRAEGRTPTLRFLFSVAMLEDPEVRVLEQGRAFFRALARLRESYPLETHAFEVRRHGRAGYLRTTYSITPVRRLRDDERARLRALALPDLESLSRATQQAQRRSRRPADAATVRFVERALAGLPAEARARFCAELGLREVADLRSWQIEEALAHLERLESELTRTLRGVHVDVAG
jgi:hypothetical protein